MKIIEHIAIITSQIEAMRKDGHDDNTPISIQLDALEYAKDTILVLDKHNPELPQGNFVRK